MFKNKGLAGKMLRLPLKAIPDGMVLPILNGDLRGAKWIAGSSTNGCWLGIYERAVQVLLGRHLQPEAVFYDIGANVGFFSLLASRLVGSRGRVVAFEPLLRNISFLKSHLKLNRISNVIVLETALGDFDGTVRLDSGKGPSTAAVGDTGEVISLQTLDSVIGSGQIPPPNVMKIDIEGYETQMLKGAETTIKAAKPDIILSAHGWKRRDECIHLLEEWGYTVTVFHAVEDEGDYGLLAVPQGAPFCA